MKRIAIAGLFGSGKTTAAKHLVYKHNFMLFGFATPLYELAQCHLQADDAWGVEVKRWVENNLGPAGYNFNKRAEFRHAVLDLFRETPRMIGKNRTLLQKLGTEIGRGVDENMWVNLFEMQVQALPENAKIVNDNLRYPNEFDSCERLGFTTVFMHADNDKVAERYSREYGEPATDAQLSHTSETSVVESRHRCRYVYNNNWNIDLLHEFLDGLVAND